MRGLRRSARWVPLAVVMCWGVSYGTASADYASAVLADNPIGYWRLNETQGDVAANVGTAGASLAGSYVDGTKGVPGPNALADGTPLNGMGAGNVAFEVGDVDQYVTVEASPMSGLSEFTMSGWVKPGPRGADRIGLFGQNDALEFGFINPNVIQMWSPGGGALNYTIDPVNQVPEDAWFHLATVGTGRQIRLYINGEQVGVGGSSLPGIGGYGSSTFKFNVGGGGVYDGTGNQLTGSVDEVAIWDKALTEAQIQGMVNAALSAGGNFAQTVLNTQPLGYWRFNEAAGSTTAVNVGVAGAELNGTYNGGVVGAPGPEGAPGLGAGNVAYQVGPDVAYMGVNGSPLNDNQAFSLAGWAKYDELGNRIGLWGQNDAVEFGFIDPDTIQIWTPGGGFANYDFFDEIAPEEWFHIAAVGDGEELRVYLNGQEAVIGGSPLATEPGTYGQSDFFFNIGGGGVYDATGNQFTGVLDEVAIWDRALTAAQIKAQFNAAVGAVVAPGDYNKDGKLDVADLDLQAKAIKDKGPLVPYDENKDGQVTDADRKIWVKDLKKTWIGDADLNFEFNSTDLINVFVAGKYETGATASWSDGDFNGDMVFGSSDLVDAFVDGGYELGSPPPAAVSAVPEPSGLVLCLVGLLGGSAVVRRRRS